MMDCHKNLSADLHIRIYQGIKRLYYPAAHSILYRHKAQVAMTFAYFIKDACDIRQRFVFDTLTEL